MKTRLIPFSIKKAKKGAKIVTREGKFPVRIVDYKIKDKYYPILALIEVDGREHPNTFTTNGKISKDEEDSFDLFIEVEEQEEEEVDNYNPYKATVESIAEISEMVDRNSDIDLRDFYDNVKVRCKEAVEYDKKWCKNQEEQKTSDSLRIMPNQWYVCIEMCHSIDVIDFAEGHYYLGSDILKYGLLEKSKDYIDYFHPWNIQDAKEGDVLYSGEVIFIFNRIKGEWIHCCCSLHRDGSFISENYDLMHIKHCKEVQPATKEQYDLLFQKMKEAGYEWDSDKKELHKIGESKTRLMTHQELAWWLRDCPEEHREWRFDTCSSVYSEIDYSEENEHKPVSNNILIRKNGGEWQEPLVEI